MDILLKIPAGLGGTHRTQLINRGFQEFSKIFLNLLADSGILQSLEQFRVLDVGKSAAQRTFHDVVINQGSPPLPRI